MSIKSVYRLPPCLSMIRDWRWPIIPFNQLGEFPTQMYWAKNCTFLHLCWWCLCNIMNYQTTAIVRALSVLLMQSYPHSLPTNYAASVTIYCVTCSVKNLITRLQSQHSNIPQKISILKTESRLFFSTTYLPDIEAIPAAFECFRKVMGSFVSHAMSWNEFRKRNYSQTE